MRALPFKPPEPGDKVGDYLVLEKLGDGGFGFVYKVERAGRSFALKVIRARELEGWGQREISILRHLEHENVVRFRACDRWPDPEHGYLYIVMDLVVGRTLVDWVLDENPSARQVAQLVLEVVRALGAILEQGVLHRDLKPENILIRDSDGRPVLVDFGVGWVVGAPSITGERSPPGTDEFRAPEFVLFERDAARRKEGYKPDAGDDLWALGITLYWLLTDTLPFGRRSEGGLFQSILSVTPVAPSERNERVPPVLSTLCMRMLEKERRARFPDHGALGEALEAALAAAVGDAAWDAPLMDVAAADALPTEQVPGMALPGGEDWAGLAWKAARPQRGRKGGPRPVPPAVGVERLASKRGAGQGLSPAEALVAVLGEVAPGHAWEAPLPPVLGAARSPPLLPVGGGAGGREPPGGVWRAWSRAFPTSLGVFPVRAVMLEALRSVALAVGVLLLAALLGAGAWALYTQAEHGLEGQPAKVAKSEEPLEAWTGADSFLTPSPAPLLATMAHSPASPANLVVTSALPASRKGLRARAAEKCATAACCAVLGACGASTPQVRPTPKPEACPANALSTMKELGIRIDDRAMGSFPVAGDAKPVPVNEFTPFELDWDLGTLPAGTVLSGRLIFGTDRVYGRFTQARKLKGKTYPVCLELQYAGKRGVAIIRDGGSSSAVIGSNADVVAVERFE
ncbi:serine/threonine protein kinase [Cystobacter ferrugineus]|uniref:Protein kinase domain-containing protein n=1 Tax=Cystobacter ferrugineus TaxID=83449 RepID=A0A1L9AVJ8_9BACT|nr:serine/threonine-protein kinase [Cystobacter ferrugineus]OJH33943.1 hypothetical protein BON30_46310 [Cystobacter ferrugineus]